MAIGSRAAVRQADAVDQEDERGRQGDEQWVAGDRRVDEQQLRGAGDQHRSPDDQAGRPHVPAEQDVREHDDRERAERTEEAADRPHADADELGDREEDRIARREHGQRVAGEVRVAVPVREVARGGDIGHGVGVDLDVVARRDQHGDGRDDRQGEHEQPFPARDDARRSLGRVGTRAHRRAGCGARDDRRVPAHGCCRHRCLLVARLPRGTPPRCRFGTNRTKLNGGDRAGTRCASVNPSSFFRSGSQSIHLA